MAPMVLSDREVLQLTGLGSPDPVLLRSLELTGGDLAVARAVAVARVAEVSDFLLDSIPFFLQRPKTLWSRGQVPQRPWTVRG
jgi:hypothetical protein